jgi:hypothetical protein
MEALPNDVAIEPKSATGSTEPDRPQLLGVFVDPVALDAQLAREGGGVGEFYGPGLLRFL